MRKAETVDDPGLLCCDHGHMYQGNVFCSQTLENTTFSRAFDFSRKPICSFWRAEMNGIHHAVHIEKQMNSERYILLPRPKGVFKIQSVHRPA